MSFTSNAIISIDGGGKPVYATAVDDFVRVDYDEIFKEMAKRFTVKPVVEYKCHNCDAAINWLIETFCAKNDRELIRRDRIAIKIMTAMRHGKTYHDFIWWREK